MLLLIAALLAAPPLIKPRLRFLPVTADATPGAGLIADRFDLAARQVLRTRRTLRLVGPGEPRLRVRAGSSDPRVERAENLRTAGRAQLEAGDAVAARASLGAALVLYERGLASVGRLEAVAAALAWLGAAEWAVGRRKAARRHLARAAILAPEERFHELPARPRKALRKLQRGARHRRATIAVRTRPEGAEVTVDGVARGRSPVKVRVAAGTHYVQAKHATAGRAAARVNLRRGRKRVRLTLRRELGERAAVKVEPAVVGRLFRALRGRRIRRKTRKRLAALAADAGADALVFGRLVGVGRAYRFEAVLYDVRRRRAVRLDPLPLSERPASITVAAERVATAVASRAADVRLAARR